MNILKSLLLLLILFIGNKGFAQKEPKDTIYWYKVDFDIVRDSANFKPHYKIARVYPEVISGTQQDYLKYQKENNPNGKIGIGPFKVKEDAIFSQHYYANIDLNVVLLEENIAGDYYWYTAAVNKIIINNRLDFTKISNGVRSGSINVFKEILYEALENMNLIMGPFPNQNDAFYAQSVNKLLIPKRLRQQSDNVFYYKAKDMDKYVDYQTKYWFRLRLNSKNDSIKKWPVYFISDVQPEIKWGNSKKYLEDQREQMKNGFVCIGPYDDMQLAKNATSYYLNYGEIKYTGETFRDTTGYSEYYYYVSQIRTMKRNKSKEFVRCPARVSESCTLLEFRQTLFEGLENHQFFIGPFLTHENAEESKRLNRILEP